MNPAYPLVAERAGYRCEYCHAPEVVFNLPFEVEHVIPKSCGGAVDETNLALSCRSCNLYKGSCLTSLDPTTSREAPLFDPRRQKWGEHFNLELANGRIIGLGGVGRATTDRLRMNSSAQMQARKQWAMLGLFGEEVCDDENLE